jgi:hypothetical protein
MDSDDRHRNPHVRFEALMAVVFEVKVFVFCNPESWL